jgi:hypothetical protein
VEKLSEEEFMMITAKAFVDHQIEGWPIALQEM